MSELASSRTILIVEDDIAIGQIRKELLKEDGNFIPVVVTTGAQALTAVQSILVDLILLDLDLPDLDGLEVYVRLQADGELRHIPVLFMSATHDEERLLSRGLDGRFFDKPFGIEDVLERLDAALGVRSY